MTRALGAVMILLAAAGFGTIGIFGKVGIDVGLNNPTLLLFRFTIAAGLLAAYLVATGRLAGVTRAALPVAAGLGLAYALLTAGFFWGLLFVPAGLAAITLFTYPVYVYGISVTLLDERLTALKLLAIALTLAGVLVIVGLDVGGADLRGIALVSLAAIAYAVYTTGSRVAVAETSAPVLATVAAAVTAGVFLVYGLATGTVFLPTAPRQWAVIVGLAIVGTAVPIALFVHGLERVEASRASILSMAEPPVTVVLGIALLGETLTAGVVGGGALILGGIYLIQRDRVTARPAAAAEAR